MGYLHRNLKKMQQDIIQRMSFLGFNTFLPEFKKFTSSSAAVSPEP